MHCPATAVSETTDPATHKAAPTQLIRAKNVHDFLLTLGWDSQWVDGITRELVKGKDDSAIAKADAAIKYLAGLGLKNRDIENMASTCKAILQTSEASLRALVEYLRAQGLEGSALLNFVARNAQLLTYVPSGAVLAKGRARASVEVGHTEDGTTGARVHVWRDGAAFGTAPVAPLTPNKQ